MPQGVLRTLKGAVAIFSKNSNNIRLFANSLHTHQTRYLMEPTFKSLKREEIGQIRT
jgi:hypothetical protein